MELARPFSGLSKADAELAGGKGASLGEMTQAGIPVPPGFVVLSSAFDRFLDETDLSQEIEAMLGKVNHQEIHTVEHASAQIQSLIRSAKMPDDIAEAVLLQYAALGAEYVAVRSSATAEDGAAAAWAGQLDTFLNTTRDAVLEKVQHCWASLFTPRAIFYRFEKGMHESSISVAVVIQKMVQSEVSGIAFSVHPITEDYNQLIIEAGYGLGEAIVSGQITPDSYVVEKEPRKVIDINTSTQVRGLYRGVSGNEWRDIPEPKASAQVLTKEQILELSELILRIEKHYGFPCDIEWAYESGQFYITQSRPITTLAGIQRRPPIRVLTKLYERERPLLYMMVWYKSDHDGLARFTHQAMPISLQMVPPAGQASTVWYVAEDIQRLQKEALDILNASESLRSQMLSHTRSQWLVIEPYLRGEAAITTPDELLKFYEELCSFWHAMNTIYFSLPDFPTFDPEFKTALFEIRHSTEKYSEKMGTYLADTFASVMPEYARFAHVVSPQDIEQLAHAPTSQLMAMLEERVAQGAFILDGVTHPMSELSVQLQAHNLQLEKADSTVSALTGATGFAGKATGKVRVLRSKNDVATLLNGEILVSALTNPDYVPAMQRAAAIVTDEGGVMSHAAIIAREMQKPCVIGTKFATQILKDGDMVEVDADQGVVRKLQIEFEKIYTRDTTMIMQELWGQCCSDGMRTAYGINNPHRPEVVHFMREGSIEIWENRNATNFLKDAVLAKNQSEELGLRAIERLGQQISILETYWKKGVADTETELCNYVEKAKDALLNFIPYYYSAVDDRTPEKIRAIALEFRKKDEFFSRSDTFIRNSILKLFPHSIHFETTLVIADIGNVPSLDELKARREHMTLTDGTNRTTEALSELETRRGLVFITDPSVSGSESVSGQVAQKGYAMGAVRILRRRDQMEDVHVGDIIVSPMTTPDFMPAMQRAAAFVTDEGGITCHAGIVARELHKPCIIGTKIATQIFKDGDLVEVDADAGVVRLLKLK